LTTLAAWARTALTTRTTLSRWTLRADFIPRQLAVAILVERLEGGGGIGNFLFVNRAVLVGVKRSHHRTASHPLPALAGPTGAALPSLTRRTIAAGTLRFILSCCEERGKTERHRGHEDCLFHVCFSCVCHPTARASSGVERCGMSRRAASTAVRLVDFSSHCKFRRGHSTTGNKMVRAMIAQAGKNGVMENLVNTSGLHHCNTPPACFARFRMMIEAGGSTSGTLSSLRKRASSAARSFCVSA
jgi:hypothetical protein